MTEEQWLKNAEKIDKAYRYGIITEAEAIAQHVRNDAAYDRAK